MLPVALYDCKVCEKRVKKDANIDYHSRDSNQVPLNTNLEQYVSKAAP
jgi:hypothetical protein